MRSATAPASVTAFSNCSTFDMWPPGSNLDDVSRAYLRKRAACRSPFEKSQILPVRNVIPCKVEMAPPGGGHILCETACQPNAGCGRGGQGPKPAGRCAQRSP